MGSSILHNAAKTLCFHQAGRVLNLLVGLSLLVFASSSWACSDSDIRFSSSSHRIYIENGATCTLSQIESIVVNKYSSVAPGELLEQTSPGVWLLKTEIQIEDGSQLNLHGTTIGGDVNTFRMLSRNGFDEYHVKIQAKHGTVDMRSVSVTSWDTNSNAPDTDLDNGRAFIHVNSVEEGGVAKESTMNIIDSEVSYLGFYDAESYGLVWKVRGGDSDPTIFDRVDVYGDIINSYIHHNYMGMYSYGAFGMTIHNSEVAYNESYGLDPHDDSDELVITDNNVHDNGNHGIICSRRCNDLVITGNHSYRNRHGIMLHRDTNDTLVENNTVYDNADNGIAIFESHRNTIRNNTITGNKHGIRLSLGSHDNLMEGNTIDNNIENGLYQYGGSDTPETTDGRPANNTFQNNLVRNNGRLIKFRDSDDILVVNNTFEGPTDVEIYDSTNIQILGNSHNFSQLEVKVDSAGTISSDATVEVDEPVDVKLTDLATVELINNDGRIFNAQENSDVTRVREMLLEGASVSSSSMVLDSGIIGTTTSVEALPFWVNIASGEIEIKVVAASKANYQWTTQSISGEPNVEYRIENLTKDVDYLLFKDGALIDTYTATNGEVTFNNLSSSTVAAFELIKLSVGQILPVIADTYVRDGFPNSNYGTRNTLEVKLSGDDYNRQTLLKFDISAYTEPVSSATLTVEAALSRVDNATTNVFSTDTNWVELAVTWADKPAVGEYLGSFTLTNKAFSTQEIDITSYINTLIATNASEAAFILVNENSSTAVTRIRAREHSSDTEATIQLQF